MTSPSDFTTACSLVHAALEGDSRARLVADLARSKPFGRALARLREHLRANSFDAFIHQFDHRTRQEGFHALHDWDGKAEQVLGEIIPIDMLDYVERNRGEGETDARALAILLDYYYFHVLSLLALRVWDGGSADENLDRVGELLAMVKGPGGSGQRFVADAETLMLVATSHFEAVERGYDRLLRRVKTLNREHQLHVALGHAASIGCHLRFGFEVTYRRDTILMRDDNAADYPWLCFALATLMREYAAADCGRAVPEGARAFSASARENASEPRRDLAEAPRREGGRASVIDALANGLSADARAFVGAAPPSLSSAEAERAEFRDLFLAHRARLIADVERCRPIEGQYSPLSFFFNFSHNVLKGIVADALLRGEPWPVTFNDLLTARLQPGPASEQTTGATYEDVRERLARTLMDYARKNPDRINGELVPVIVYDARAGHRAFRIMMEKLVEGRPPAPSP